jgi:hypothetical protein
MKEYNASGGGGGTAASGESSKPSSKGAAASKNISPTKVRYSVLTLNFY